MANQAQAVNLPQLKRAWPNLAAFLVVGYLGIGKPFAYLGLPWIGLYIGEIALTGFLLFGPTTKQGPWLHTVRLIPRLKRLEWLLLLSLLYGGYEALRGILKGYPAFTALRDTAFNYYPLFVFLGVWVGLRGQDFFRRVIGMLASWAAYYGLAWILFLSRVPWTMPGTEGKVLVFMDPQGASVIALLGLLAFEPQLRAVWRLILLNVFVLLGVQSRAEWLGFAVGAIVFAWYVKKVKRLVMAGGLIIVLFGLMYITGLSLLSPNGRGEKVGNRISAAYLVARAIAPLSQNLADELAPAPDVRFAAGTAEWRLVWWANIWQEVHERLFSAFMGLGYGYPIGDLNPYIESGTFVQTPHNVFLYALAFSGWFGVALFVFLQVELYKLLLRSYRVTGQPFGLMCWAAMLTTSLFGDFFEAPFGSIPFYLLVGASITPALFARQRGGLNGALQLPNAPTRIHGSALSPHPGHG